MPQVAYRYDYFYTEHSIELILYEYTITKVTPCGMWLDVYGVKKFVNTKARKQYASLSKEDALECYYARKRRQLGILRSQVLRVEIASTLEPTEVVRLAAYAFGGYDFGE